VIDSATDFDEAIARFLDWRLQHDQDVKAGRARAVEEELVEAA
jgi:hypothetical protein